MPRKAQEVYASGGDVLAKVRRLYRKAFFGDFIEKLRMYQMDLAKVGLRRINLYA